MLNAGRYTSQQTNILKHLERGESITPLDALEQYGCFRLAAVIFNLRADGHKIKTKKITRRGKTYASYKLEALAK
tara:strand:+ start:500 stop:724 length:225 start_codon:yes stop_codon:yes gene_type:complete